MDGNANFMLADLGGILVSSCVFPLFLLPPGYVLGWLADLFGFRRRRPVARLLLSLVLSISVSPILIYLIHRSLGLQAVWSAYGAVWIACAAILIRERRTRVTPIPKACDWITFTVVSTWLAIVALSLVDVQYGDRVFFSFALNVDYTKHIAVTGALARTGIPPVNPSFHPGYRLELFYYYFWFMICSLVDRCGGALVTARSAVLGGTLWSGLGLTAAVALAVRRPRSGSDAGEARFRVKTAMILLLVSGLDLLPVLARAIPFLLTSGRLGFLYPSVEWWNTQITGWVATALWVPHHLAAFVACWTGFGILQAARLMAEKHRRSVAVFCAGCAFASAAGMSVWVAFTFAVFLVLWLALCLVKRWQRDAVLVAAAGVVALVLILPFLRDLHRSKLLIQDPVTVEVRRFEPAEKAVKRFHMDDDPTRALVNLILLPVNYFLELGFVGVAGILYWRQRRTQGIGLDQQDYAHITMLATSFLVCSFLRSTVKFNDLGIRGWLFGQFVLLLWAVELVASARRSLLKSAPDNSRPRGMGVAGIRTLALLAFLGFGTTVCDLVLLRVRPFYLYGRQGGEQTFKARRAYDWIEKSLPGETMVQHNPHVAVDPLKLGIEVFHGVYCSHPTAAADLVNGTLYGIPHLLFLPVFADLTRLFMSDSDFAAVEAICRKYGIGALVVKGSDPIWNRRTSWVWTQRPAYANDFVRVFVLPAKPGKEAQAGNRLSQELRSKPYSATSDSRGAE